MSFLRKISLIFCLLFCCCSANAKNSNLRPKPIWNLPSSNEYFIGRSDILECLQQLFANRSQAIAVTGSAGIGKTQLAKRYAENYRGNYDIIWWIDSEKNIKEQLKTLAVNWNKTNQDQQDQQINIDLALDEITALLKDRLRTTDLNWLLIFDNATDKNQILGYIPSKHSNRGYGHVLITSKNPLSWGKTMKIDKFKRAESIEALNKITGENDKTSVNLLADTLKDYPLAIVQAASYIKSHPGLTMAEYQELFLTKRMQLWNQENKNPAKYEAFDNYQFTVFTALSLTIKNLKTESPAGFDLLALCSLLGSKNIPSNILKLYATTILKLDVIGYYEAIADLVKYSLISEGHEQQPNGKNSQSEGSVFTMHELVQLTMLDLLSGNKKRQYAQQGLKVFAKFLPDKLDVLMPMTAQYPYYISHMEILTKKASQYSILSDDLIVVKIRQLEYYLSGKRDFAISQGIIDEISKMQTSKLTPSTLSKIRFALMKSAILMWRDENYSDSAKGALYALDLLETIKGHNEERLMIYNRLAQSYNLLGDNDNALKYAKYGESLVNSNRDLGNQDALFQSLAKIYADKGSFDQALKYASISEAKLADAHDRIIPGDVLVYITKYNILLKMGKYHEVYQGLDQLHQNLDAIFGNKEHSYRYVIEIYHAYACFLATDSVSISKRRLLENIKNLEEITGKNSLKNKQLALGHKFLGSIYEKEGDLMAAREEYNIALQIYRNNYGDYDQIITDDFSDLFAKLALISIKLGDSDHAQGYLRLHSDRFGFDHPRTVMIAEHMLRGGMKVEY